MTTEHQSLGHLLAAGGGAGGPAADRDLVEGLRADVLAALTERTAARQAAGGLPLGPADEQALGRQLIAEALERRARQALSAGDTVMSGVGEDRLARAVFDALFRLNRLQRLLDDPGIENINANGCDVVWVRYADGRREQAEPIAESDAELEDMLRTAAARVGIGERRFDRGSPRISLQLPDGSRLFALMAVAARPCVSIRRHRYLKVTLDDLIATGTVDIALREFLRALMAAKKSCIICGGTGAGKTTLLRAMAADIPASERLITIEDSLELGLDRYPDLHPDCIALESREANLEGQGGVSLAELVRWALRMSPDRVIVGEARGDEVLALLNAMSQGTDGSMATLHASSSRGAFSKLATYAIQAPERLPLEATNLLVANAVHFVIHLARDGERRVVSSIREVTGAEGPMVASNEVFRPDHSRRAVPGAPLRNDTLDQLVAVGFDPGLLERPEGWWEQ
ncbi:Flp pilus assembly complex ATPase component TadA [Acidiferrimicrobium sp. IK]|uniref:CpaF family protein n=1 Tax=Acidiferrimicrobium sp. IK TaxID=2871700 RepID=UPI0021CAECE9|nr:ATPase, T2SS/T4P/T4SS family [Acidiferrimicrobium sp. IK]MCU4185157.1 Flp pilus assembly complex ATPase component TadA [Acidiferrimicrobium sp. IK]